MPTSIEWRYLEDGSHERVSCRTGRIIPIPPSSEETKDYKYAEIYKEQEKDTTEKDVKKVTFEVHKFCNFVSLFIMDNYYYSFIFSIFRVS